MKKQELIDLLLINQKNSIGTTFFTTENVIEFVNKLEEPDTTLYNASVLEIIENCRNITKKAIEKAVWRLEANEVIDYPSAEFSLEKNQIILDFIDLNESEVEEKITESVNNAFDTLIEETK
jgi:hypothetical protein